MTTCTWHIVTFTCITWKSCLSCLNLHIIIFITCNAIIRNDTYICHHCNIYCIVDCIVLACSSLRVKKKFSSISKIKPTKFKNLLTDYCTIVYKIYIIFFQYTYYAHPLLNKNYNYLYRLNLYVVEQWTLYVERNLPSAHFDS